MEAFYQDRRREYWQCAHCELIFVPSRFHLSAEQEQAEYALHQNDQNDSGYRRFLQRMAEPMIERLEDGQSGLDFGCGPGPTLSLMFAEKGYQTEHYDPLFFAEQSLLEQQYDFVTATEVVEHFNHPRQAWDGLVSLLKPQAWLGIMTKRHLGRERFAQWHYKNDQTHVAFYSDNTMAWLAEHYQLELSIVGTDVVIFREMSGRK